MDIEAAKKRIVGNLGEDISRQKAEKEHIYMPMFLDRLVSYDNSAFFNKFIDLPLQVITVIGAVTVPILLSNPSVPKAIPFTISIVVAIAAALANRFKFGERARTYTITCEAMRRERLAYEFKRKSYRELGVEEAFVLFMERVEDILHEHSQRAIYIEDDLKAKRD
ncbi:MAG TPA: DUF4231 domain-containing protein [Methylomirabilota bacterium]|nr:DUF4231 domain-containing protein [Methylomirabilota bacterium]